MSYIKTRKNNLFIHEKNLKWLFLSRTYLGSALLSPIAVYILYITSLEISPTLRYQLQLLLFYRLRCCEFSGMTDGAARSIVLCGTLYNIITFIIFVDSLFASYCHELHGRRLLEWKKFWWIQFWRWGTYLNQRPI